ncbi:MAG TPA: ELWxxDGT repeat protein, partial [Cytophagales bacterium]
MPDLSRLSAFLRRVAGLLGAYWLVAAAGLLAQPVLVKDINTLTNPGGPHRFEPTGLTRVGNQVFFVAGTLAHGYELWRSDGTAAGTGLLKDIYPGFLSPTIMHVTAAGNALFFLANDGVHGYELWKSDGTGAGTRLVKDIAPGAGSINIIQVMTVQNTAYFVIALSKYAYQLWRSDGTPGGTILLRQLIPDPESLQGPQLLAGLGNRLYFATYTTASGRELWRTDGTPAGTVMVKDAAPGVLNSQFEGGSFAALNGKLCYLSWTDLEHEPQFCLTDGTAAGTVRLRDTDPRVVMPALKMIRSLLKVGNRLFFTSYDATLGEELWLTDGTAAGTRLVKDIAPGYWPDNGTLPNSSVPGSFFDGDGLLYFL